MKITEEENKELTADELKMVAGGDSLRDEYFNKSTELLKEAGDRVLTKLGEKNKLWEYIKIATNVLTTSERKEYIMKAWESLKIGWFFSFSSEDIEYVDEKLSQAGHYNFLAQLEEY